MKVDKKKSSFEELLEDRVSEYKTDVSLNERSLYRVLGEFLGFYPLRLIVPIAVLAGLLTVLLLKGWAVKGVNVLQWGF